VIGAIALYTDNALFYRLLNASPFNEYPGQNTVAFPIEITVRVYTGKFGRKWKDFILNFQCWVFTF
jgi:hypothetical protein